MLNVGSMGVALREIGGDRHVTIVTRHKDFNMVQLPQEGTPDRMSMLPVDQLFSFTAVGFREIGDGADIWEFRVVEATAAGPVQQLLYLRGSDVFWVKASSRLAQVVTGG